ncbi:MAG TPA: hypothetical protein VM680_15450 [Verrucomicrobiae bacterium]|nr:hypothetical protein [Verrucomicrobiae bacterium]
MKILATDIPPLWKKFLSGGTQPYDKLAAEFQNTQPDLWNQLKQIDADWFSAKTDHVVAYGVFIWSAISSAYGPPAPVPKSLIEQLQQQEEKFLASIEDESDYAIKNALAERRRNFPEPALASHIEREFEEGSARAKELNPTNNRIALNALLITIHALVRTAGSIR